MEGNLCMVEGNAGNFCMSGGNVKEMGGNGRKFMHVGRKWRKFPHVGRKCEGNARKWQELFACREGMRGHGGNFCMSGGHLEEI